jgi:hypothetical protein
MIILVPDHKGEYSDDSQCDREVKNVAARSDFHFFSRRLLANP